MVKRGRDLPCIALIRSYAGAEQLHYVALRHPIAADTTTRQLSWRRGVLDFDCVKLANAIEEINRYNSLHLQIVGPIVGDDHISGVGFSPTDPTLFAKTAAALIPNMTWNLSQPPSNRPSQPAPPSTLQLHQSSPPSPKDAPPQRCTPQDASADDR